MRRKEMLWWEKHPTVTLDMKQLYNQQHSIMKKHLLLDLELEELSRLAELNDTVQEELEDMSDSPAETPNVLVDESSLSAENLPTDIQTLRQKIMDHLPTEQGQRSYLPKLRYELTDEILAQTNLALETIPTVNITKTHALIYATVKALQESAEKRGLDPKHPAMPGSNSWRKRSRDWDQMSANSVR